MQWVDGSAGKVDRLKGPCSVGGLKDGGGNLVAGARGDCEQGR